MSETCFRLVDAFLLNPVDRKRVVCGVGKDPENNIVCLCQIRDYTNPWIELSYSLVMVNDQDKILKEIPFKNWETALPMAYQFCEEPLSD